MTDENKQDKEVRLEKARKALLDTLKSLRESELSEKEADAVEAAIEDQLIALRDDNPFIKWFLIGFSARRP